MNRTWGMTDILVLAIFIITLLHWLGVNPS